LCFFNKAQARASRLFYPFTLKGGGGSKKNKKIRTWGGLVLGD